MRLHARRMQGYALPLVLAFLAVLGLVAGYFASRVQQAVDNARTWQTLAEGMIEVANARADLLLMLNTGRFYSAGLAMPNGIRLRFDDRPYRWRKLPVAVSIQDPNGLINVNAFRADMMGRFLGQTGVSAKQYDHYIDVLRDYVDYDTLRRLNGAEGSDYREAGLPPPRNDLFHSVEELRRVLLWRDWLADPANAEWQDWLTGARSSGFNPMTAPPKVLQTLPGVTPELLPELLKARELRRLTEVDVGASVELLEDLLVFFPGGVVRISFASDKLPWLTRYNLMFTPIADDRPFRILDTAKAPAKPALVNASRAIDAIPFID